MGRTGAELQCAIGQMTADVAAGETDVDELAGPLAALKGERDWRWAKGVACVALRDHEGDKVVAAVGPVRPQASKRLDEVEGWALASLAPLYTEDRDDPEAALVVAEVRGRMAREWLPLRAAADWLANPPERHYCRPPRGPAHGGGPAQGTGRQAPSRAGGGDACRAGAQRIFQWCRRSLGHQAARAVGGREARPPMSHSPPVGARSRSRPSLRYDTRMRLFLYRVHAKGQDRIGRVTSLSYSGDRRWECQGWLLSEQDYRDLASDWWPWVYCSGIVKAGQLLGVVSHNDSPPRSGLPQ